MKTIKLLPLIISASMLAACSYTPPQPKYKISDADTQRWIEKGNQVEQCVFAKEYRQKNLILPQEEHFLHKRYVWENTLIDTIGLINVQLLMNDSASREYLALQQKKFNHSNPTTFDQNWCNTQKQNYQQELKQLKAETKQRNAEAQKRQAGTLARQRQAEKELEAEAKKRQAEELARKRQAEKERKELEAFYKTPQGRIVKAQEEMAAAQWAAAQAQQQAAYAQEQAAYAAERRAKQAENAAFWNNINNSIKSNTPRYTTCYGNAYGNQATC